MQLNKFIDGDYREFVNYDNYRMLPSAVDGLKPSQRKVIFAIRKFGKGEIKVERLGGYASGETDYNHGEDSLKGVACGLAQDFSGSNNVNVLEPCGQFGSILDPAPSSYRYIFTKQSQHMDMLFHPDDEHILMEQYSGADKIEPTFYYPLLPFHIINGSYGVGNGHASTFLCYNPKSIKGYIQKKLQGTTPRIGLVPWYKGYTGSIERCGKQTVIKGVLEVVNTTTVKITQLPIRTYREGFKKHLNKLMDVKLIKSFEDLSTDEGWLFNISVPRSTTAKGHDYLMDLFKLVYRVTENYTVRFPDGQIKRFDTVEEVIDVYMGYRIEAFEQRRLKLIEMRNGDLKWLKAKLTFINMWNSTNNISKYKKQELIDLMLANDLQQCYHDRLLSLKVYNLTPEKVGDLRSQIKEVQSVLKDLKSSTATDMYQSDLKDLKL